MLLRLDHLVIAVYDPDDAAAELERRVGLACSGGGRHPAWGTYNRLAWFGDTYVELIGVSDHSLTGQGPVSLAAVVALDSGSEGLVSYAIATDGAVGDLNRLRAAGSTWATSRHARGRGRTARSSAGAPPSRRPSGRLSRRSSCSTSPSAPSGARRLERQGPPPPIRSAARFASRG